MSELAAAVRPTHYARPLLTPSHDDATMSTAFLDAFYTDPFNRLVARSRVQCADMPDIFSPDEVYLGDETSEDREERIAWAKAICADCPIFDTCRDRSVGRREPAGIWGGLTEDERESLRRRTTRTDTRRGVHNRNKTHCNAGHAFDADNTKTALDRNGATRRQCRQCRTTQKRESRIRIRAREAAAREAVA